MNKRKASLFSKWTKGMLALSGAFFATQFGPLSEIQQAIFAVVAITFSLVAGLMLCMTLYHQRVAPVKKIRKSLNHDKKQQIEVLES